MKLVRFELDSIRTILEKEAPELMEHFPHLEAISRKDNGVGRVIALSEDNEGLDQDKNLTLGKRLYADIEGMTYGVGFMLFIEGGVLSELEIFSHGNEIIPDPMSSYSFRYV